MPEPTSKECEGMEEACLCKEAASRFPMRHDSFVNKLRALFEQQISAIEGQGDGPQRLETLERDCKALDLLARAFDRLVQTEMRTKTALETQIGRCGKKTGGETVDAKSTSEAGSEKAANELRDELARRLYGLQQRKSDTQPLGLPE
ncbi:MAG: hypothetical protein ABJO09_07120 [Hyphomicrobiales bacterium]